MKNVRLLLFVFVFSIAAVLCGQIISRSLQNQENKKDYAEINSIRYGLFSVNKWKQKLALIMADEISRFSLTEENEKQLKTLIEGQLGSLIDKVYEKIRQSNKGSVKGWMKQKFVNVFVDIEEIKKGIPEYASVIMKEMHEQRAEHKLKEALKKRVDQYFDKTFETQDLTRFNAILARMETSDIEAARVKLDQLIASDENSINTATWLLVLLSVLTFAIIGYLRLPLTRPQYFILLLLLLLLLAAGVTTPMIDMEVKIAEMSFVLLDHPVSFLNQVLYFQSKSIIDVFWLMLTHKKPEMKFVGLLLVTFSIIFPLLKMFSTIRYYFNHKQARESRWIQFFVFKSGKWSMTDVLVVAIFMAYIGFNGIITSQFAKLNSLDKEIVFLTTNGTALQSGFYLFFTYTVLSLFLSSYLLRNASQK